MRLQDKVIIVTGSAGAGIGQTSARRFAEEGANVVVSDTHEKRTKEASEMIRDDFGVESIGVLCDVTNQEHVDNLVAATLEKFGRIDGLMNNAGINVLNECVDITDEQWDLVFDVCIKGTFRCVRAVLPAMIKQESGSIVSLSSTAGLEGAPNQCHYAAAKAGVVAFSKSVGNEVAKHGIRLNAIAPGLIMNPFLERIYPKEQLEGYLETIPLPRKGEPKDIANTALFLMSDEGYYLTGQTLCVSGGSWMVS